MSIHHLLRVIDRLQSRPNGPHLEHSLIPFAIFVGVLFALAPADFKDYLTLEAAVWEAMALIIAVLSGVASVGLFINWLVWKAREKPKSSEDIVREILAEMANDMQKVEW